MMGFGLFGIFDVVFPIFFLLTFGLVFGTIISTLVKNAKQERKNDASPRLTVDASVVAKRTHVWGRRSHTSYYATFQVESGDRMELEVAYNEYGYLIEGDRGKLTFQGTRFLGFQRT